MKDNVDKLNAWYGLQIYSIDTNGQWLSIKNYDTLEAARKALCAYTRDHKADSFRIVKITVTMEVVE